MAIELATAYVTLQASAQGIGKSISAELGAPLAAAGALGGKQIEQGVTKTFDAKAVGATAGKALAVGVGAGIAGGAALFKIGESFDAAFDTIRTGTGATGAALDGLKEDFRGVFANVPADAQSVGTAIADINTRLGLTGKPLQALSEQFLNLSRVTGTDLSTNVASLTRVFGDWNIDTANQSESLDKIFRAAQASGIGLDQLSQSVVQFGAPLRNLGFGFDQSLALLSQFDKAGVNTQTVFAGLKAGVGNLAKAGEDVPTTFRRVVDEIKAVGPGTEATAKAIELFGQRAGPDLADAIAGGKFEIDGLLGAITGGADTINTAAADTEDFGEKWQKLVNRVLIALEPSATKVFTAVGDAVEALTPTIEKAAAGFAGFIDFLQRNKGLAQGLAAGLGALAVTLGSLAVVGKVVGTFNSFATAIKGLPAAFNIVKTAVTALNAALLANPIFLIIGAIVALGVALFLAYKKFEGFRNVVDTVGRFIRDSFLKALDGLKNWWETNGPRIIETAQAVWEGIKAGVETVGKVLGRVFGVIIGTYFKAIKVEFKILSAVVSTVWNAITAAASFAWRILEPIFKVIGAFIRGVLIPTVMALGVVFGVVFQAAGSAIAAIWGGVIQPVFAAIGAVITGVLVPAFRIIAAIVGEVFTKAAAIISFWWNTVTLPVLRAVGAFITDTVVPVFQRFAATVEKVFNNFGAIIQTVWESVIRPTFDAISAGVRVVASFIGDRVNDIKTFFSTIGSAIGDAFRGLADIIQAPFKAAFNAIARLWNRTVGKLSFKAPSWVPFGIGGKGFDVPDIPTFHTGGVVPGPKGSEQMIMALAGERVLSPAESRNFDASAPAVTGGDTMNVTYNIMGNRAPEPEDLLRAVRSDKFRRGLVA